jgi:hypothetical protein
MLIILHDILTKKQNKKNRILACRQVMVASDAACSPLVSYLDFPGVPDGLPVLAGLLVEE